MKKTIFLTFLVLLAAIAATARAADLPFIFFTAPNVVSWQDHGDAPGGGCNTGGTNHFAPDQFFILNATGSMNVGGAGYAYPSSDTIVYSSTSVPHEYAKDSSATLEDLGLMLPGGVSTSIQLSEGEWGALCPSPYFPAVFVSAPTSTTGSLAGALTVLWPPALPTSTYPFPAWIVRYQGDPITCSPSFPCALELSWWRSLVGTSTVPHAESWTYRTDISNASSAYFYLPSDFSGTCPLMDSGCLYSGAVTIAGGIFSADTSTMPFVLNTAQRDYLVTTIPTSTLAEPSSTIPDPCTQNPAACNTPAPRTPGLNDPYANCVDTSTVLGFPTGVIHQDFCQTGVLFFTMTDDEQQSAQDYVSGTMSVARQQPPFSLTQGPAAAIALIASTTATTSASLSVGATLAAPVINFVDPFGAGSVVLLFALGIIKVIHII